MNEQIKITEEELKTITTIQSKFQEKLVQFGKLYLEKMEIDEAIRVVAETESKTIAEFKELKKQENEIIDSILKKYGEGSLDIRNGVFIPEPITPKTS